MKSRKSTIWEDLVNVNSIYYKLLLQLYEDNKEYPLEKSSGRELHHKIPKFYFKLNNLQIDNSDENLVSLAKKDHFLAHYYIWKCANEKYVSKAAGPINFMLRFVTKGLSTTNLTDEDILYIEALMKNGSGNLAVKGTHWYNNGEIQVMTKECPEGFVPGRIDRKTFAELKLKKAEESKKARKLHTSLTSSQTQLRKAKGYIDANTHFHQGLKDLVLDIWQNSTDSHIKEVVENVKSLVKLMQKEPSILDTIKYYMLHPEEWQEEHREYTNYVRREALIAAGAKARAENIEKLKEDFKKFLSESPDHSRYWYWYAFIKGKYPKNALNIKRVTEKESKELIGLAYREVNEENLGYIEFKKFYSLNRLKLIERLEKKGLLEFFNYTN